MSLGTTIIQRMGIASSSSIRAKDVPAIIIGMQVINYRDYEGDNDLAGALIQGALANQSPASPPAFTLPGNESTKQSLSAG